MDKLQNIINYKNQGLQDSPEFIIQKVVNSLWVIILKDLNHFADKMRHETAKK